MHWYQGGIAEAVGASKGKGAIFVVYVEGKDDKSRELTNLINKEEVSQQLERDHFVAIKVEENSVPHQQFSQIYKQVTVPSIFFIGKTGAPLEIITEPQSSEGFLSKLQQILRKGGVNITPQSIGEQSNSFIKAEQSQQSSSVACENGACTLKPKDSPSTSKETEADAKPEAEQPNLSQDEKVERAQELINQKRDAKRAEEEESTRLKEIERRKMGQDVQKMKRWQQDNELKELMQERNKEKKEQQEARQRVLAQIAQDKAERAARFAPQPPNNKPAPQVGPQLVHRNVTNSNSSRLQFKLPDGSSHTHEFPTSETLQSVRNYIITHMDLPFSSFTLSTTFPRREFTAENSSETLLELELVPNAVMLILPVHHGAVAANSDSWFMTLLWSIVGPILNLMNYLKAKMFGGTGPGSTPPPNQERKRPNENAGEQSDIPKKRMGETSVIRRQGNVHRLTDKADSDEDNNTWNGNSTQQM